MSMTSGHVVVVGGGVIGTACAYYLSKAGRQVTILDRGKFGMACSHANCGYICPSHVLPLAAPGAISSSLRAMLKPNSAFYIKPRFSWALWSWLFKFARRCNKHDMLETGKPIQALLNSSRQLYEELIQTESLDCEFEKRGLLFVYMHQKPMDHYAETDKLLREHFNMPAKRYDGPALNELEPALKPGLAGGWHYEGDAHLRPDKLMSSWRGVLEKRGVAIQEDCDVHGFDREGHKAVSVQTSQGEIQADSFVVATGAWTPFLNKHLGCRIPIQPGKGYSITMARPSRCPVIPLIFEEHRVGVTPMKSGYRLGSTMEFSGYDTSLNRGRLDILREGARHYLHEPFGEPVQEEWFGWRPMTYDSKPIIDRSPIMSNVLIAAGHNMLGLSMATGTGKLVAELIAGETPHMDVQPYAVNRF